jgi:F-type H+-transporting ATPase subunit delta
MIGGSAARRYAKALLLIAQQQGNNDALSAEIDRLAQTYDKNAELKRALMNPAFSLTQRQAVLDEVSRKLVLSKPVADFARLLLARGRIGQLPLIARHYRTMVDELMGRVRAKVTSATPLDFVTETRIKAALGRTTGKNVILEKQEDPSLLGGVVTQVGDMLYDGSLRTQLEQLRQRYSS